MLSRPPVPPRRAVPPPPPARRPAQSSEEEEAPTPRGIAARIANLQLDQIGRSPLQQAETAPPPPPRRNAAPPPPPPRRAPAIERDPELVRLLSRKPPPPPVQARANSAPAVPARRLPPRLPTPEPEPEPEPEYVEEEEQSDEGYQSQAEEPSDSCIKCHDFSFVDAHAASFPRHTVSSVQQLAFDLTAPFDSETEKARALFTWLHHNIAYDAVSFLSGNLKPATADSVLRSGLAVCDGYAGLYLSLAEYAGLQAHKVTGHGKGVGYAALGPNDPVPSESSNHAWNCVLMDGEWRLLDGCWGAGALSGSQYIQRFDPIWFISTAEEFGKRHFPTDTSYQLLPEPISWEEYICEPDGPTIFNDFHTLNFLKDLLQPASPEIASGGWVTFCIFKQCEHMSRAQEDNYVYFINAPDDTKTPLEVNSEGGWSASIYFPRGMRGDVSLNRVTLVNGEDAKGMSTQAWKNAIGRKSMSWGGMARWTMI
ncbi:kyphoscoliosis peptidase [Roridomyces roridus]|uniref:Kyphoscoliosis peptidase n=1 Tax=Roridomyces roridus TaxID=1738132 RepID=A0AAD7CF54_9AGAR|nr:kyphoscoliosis peptidase [Roridomyces roridus]